MTVLRLGVLAYPVERPRGVAAYAAKMDRLLEEARAAGAGMVVMPEYAPVELGAALAGTACPDEAAELAAMVEAAPAILEAMRAAARHTGLWVVPGSLPMRGTGGAVLNRSPVIAPDGRMAFQDKVVMTRFESERWSISGGAVPSVFETPWGRIGVSICYDIEFPMHARAQVEAGAWLVLVPTCTDTPHGYNRVRLTAAARAVENQCFVAVAPTVGAAPWSAALDENRGTAAVFGPADRGFPEDGVIAEGVPDAPGWIFADLDPARIDAVRRDGAVRNHADWPRRPFPKPRAAVFA